MKPAPLFHLVLIGGMVGLGSALLIAAFLSLEEGRLMLNGTPVGEALSTSRFLVNYAGFLEWFLIFLALASAGFHHRDHRLLPWLLSLALTLVLLLSPSLLAFLAKGALWDPTTMPLLVAVVGWGVLLGLWSKVIFFHGYSGTTLLGWAAMISVETFVSFLDVYIFPYLDSGVWHTLALVNRILPPFSLLRNDIFGLAQGAPLTHQVLWGCLGQFAVLFTVLWLRRSPATTASRSKKR